MDAKEPAESEEVRFEDLDLVYIFSFDLGAPVEAEDLKELLKWFSEGYKMVEGIWIPPKEFWPTPQFVYRKAEELEIEDAEKTGIEELMKNEKLREKIDSAHAIFREIISEDREAFEPEYLELGRYARLKLTDLNVKVKNPELGHLNELKCELYLLLHSAGVGVLTAWIHLNESFSTDELIKIERELYKAESTIEDSFGNIAEGTLHEFIRQSVIKPLCAAILLKEEYGSYGMVFGALKKGDITEDKIKEKLRTPYFSVRAVLCTRKHRCSGKCVTAEDALERHLREIAGIFVLHENWRYYREDAAKKDLGENLSSDADYAIFVAGPTSLFLGSVMLDEELKSEEDKELAYRSRELLLVRPMEFLSLSDMILDVYTSVYRNKFKEIKERRKRGETVKPSEIAEIREGLMEGLEEYSNVSLFMTDPEESIMEYGKERLGLSDKVGTLKSLLEELDNMARTFYEEDLSRKQFLLAILFGIFGVFQALEYLEPKIGLSRAFAITLTIFILSYLLYGLYPFRRKKS
jgi:hypothetical protein